ncbi:nicotinamide-nucleotide amidase [Isoptericola jiangsuensis]|uniref:Nicotinamide-nucleotide amidase n=1 Tax=Isoptericola jiangsuensis TaxID=548579 RepID=A0A2A9EWA3_9MICO|nr:CinA family protein [Isoptericola jiangsuensis]PFG42801.1 nicotinamide-nucleotide amidase [Isoptericola jiangsuensis]
MTPHDVLAAARSRGWTLGVAESLTGGLVTARLVDVPGASTVLRGGVVAYATDLKASLLDVDPGLLDRRGPVDPDVAVAMADGVRRRTGADVGLATTGVAGPGPQDGVPAGTVFVAVVTPDGPRVTGLTCDGDRDSVRRAAVEAVLGLAGRALAGPGE